MQPRRPFLRQWLGRLTLAVAGTLSALLALEAGLRLFDDSGPSLFVRDTLVGKRYQPGYDGTPWIPEAGRNVHLRFNQIGFRGPDHDFAKPAGVRRVAVLGDSFMVSVAVDEESTMSAQLERRLNDSGESWEVLNFGAGAYSTAQSLLVWRNFASRFSPDVVLLCFYNGNDLWDNDERLTNFPRPYFRLDDDGRLVQQPLSSAHVSFSNWLNQNSRLYVWQKDRMSELRHLRYQAATLPPDVEIHNSDPPAPYPQAWQLTEALIATLASEVQGAGARFVLVAIPTHEQVVDEYWQAMLAALGPERAASFRRDYADERLAALASRLGVEFLALAPTLRAAPVPAEVHFGKGHWNENGNRLAAAAVHRSLVGTNAAADVEIAGRDRGTTMPGSAER